MSTNYGVRKRQRGSSQHLSPHPRDIPRQLHLLAPKGTALPCHPETPVQDQQPTEGHDVNLQQSVTSQSYVPLKPVSSSHGFTSTSSPHPDHTFSSLEQTQHSAVAPWADIYFNRGLSMAADSSFPELARGDLNSEVGKSVDLSSQHLLSGNLQLQENTRNRHDGDYWLPTLNAPEDAVWTPMVQPTIGSYQDQSLQYTINQHPPIPSQPLSAVQPAYHAPFQQNSQHVACVNCPTIWRSHLESIMLSDPEDKGMCGLKRTYQQLQQHIYEAHQHYGASCAWCEYLVCYHLGKMMLLEVAEGNFAHARIDLGNSFMMWREHIQEAHGGR